MNAPGFLPLKGEYHDNLLDVQASARGMLDRDVQPCLFNRLDWLDLLHRQALQNKQPFIWQSSESGKSVWLPLMTGHTGQLMAYANWYNFTWEPIFTGNFDEVTKLSLLRDAALRLAKHARRITLNPVPIENDSTRLITTAFSQAGWFAHSEKCDDNHILRIKGRSFDEYWKDRPGQLRSTVKRKGNKGVVAIRIEREFTDSIWADYSQVYAKSWKTEEGNPEFLRQLAQQESEAGALRIGLAYVDAKPVAAQFWTVENGQALIHKLAHDEAFLASSPGTLLSAALFQYVMDIDRVELIDFGTGNDSYKSDWMEENRPRFVIDLLWPNHPINWGRISKYKLSGNGA